MKILILLNFSQRRSVHNIANPVRNSFVEGIKNTSTPKNQVSYFLNFKIMKLKPSTIWSIKRTRGHLHIEIEHCPCRCQSFFSVGLNRWLFLHTFFLYMPTERLICPRLFTPLAAKKPSFRPTDRQKQSLIWWLRRRGGHFLCSFWC